MVYFTALHFPEITDFLYFFLDLLAGKWMVQNAAVQDY